MFISVLIVLVCVVLILIVLVQNSKGGGLASNFSSSTQILGVAKTKDILEQITWGAAGVLLILCLAATPKKVSKITTNTPDKTKAGTETKLSKEEESETKRMAKNYQSGGTPQLQQGQPQPK